VFFSPSSPAFFGVSIMVTVEEYRLDRDSMGEVKVLVLHIMALRPSGRSELSNIGSAPS